MKTIIAVSVLLLCSCAIQPPRPSIWQLEATCATYMSLGGLSGCIRSDLDFNYGQAWHRSQRVEKFLNFIDASADRVANGQMTDSDARLEISAYSNQAQQLISAQEDAPKERQQLDWQRTYCALAAGAGPDTSQARIAAAQCAQWGLAGPQPDTATQGPAQLLVFGGSDHRTYLGCLSCDASDANSVQNRYGNFGSSYSSTSVANSFGPFGSTYSNYSACNPDASDPPVVVDRDGNFYGHLTVNSYGEQRIQNAAVRRWLATTCTH